MKNGISDRMKAYERACEVKLTRRLPMIIRLDGKAFHSWVKKTGCVRPFDHTLMEMMAGLTKYLCENISGSCYALRASLCVRWVMARNTMPPTSFPEVRAGVLLSEEESRAIECLLILKAGAKESERIVPEKALEELLRDRFDEVRANKWPTSTHTNNLSVITQIFQE